MKAPWKAIHSFLPPSLIKSNLPKYTLSHYEEKLQNSPENKTFPLLSILWKIEEGVPL